MALPMSLRRGKKTAFLRAAFIGGGLALALGVTTAGVAWLTPKSTPRARHAASPQPASAHARPVTKRPASQPGLAAPAASKMPAAPAVALAAHHVRVRRNRATLPARRSAAPTWATE